MNFQKSIKDSTYGRRHWEVTTNNVENEENAEKKGEAPSATRNLAGRSDTINLFAKLGKTELFNKDVM